MKGQLQIYYDEEGDFLEIHIGQFTSGYFKDIGEGIAQRIDEKTGKTTGIAILSFKKRTHDLKDLKLKLPFQLHITPA